MDYEVLRHHCGDGEYPPGKRLPSGALVALRGAIIATGIGALVVAAGYCAS